MLAWVASSSKQTLADSPTSWWPLGASIRNFSYRQYQLWWWWRRWQWRECKQVWQLYPSCRHEVRLSSVESTVSPRVDKTWVTSEAWVHGGWNFRVSVIPSSSYPTPTPRHNPWWHRHLLMRRPAPKDYILKKKSSLSCWMESRVSPLTALHHHRYDPVKTKTSRGKKDYSKGLN